MIEHYLNIKMAALGYKTFAATATGGLMAVGAILGEANGTISESTGIAIGFVGGIVVAAASASWFIRGLLDELRNEIKNLKDDNKRLKKHAGID